MTESTESTTASPDTDGSSGPLAILGALFETLRPQQWIKNLFVLAPLFFSLQFRNLDILALGLAATLLFCLAAGSVYLINDIFDVEKDRNHPVKCKRPIPSGRLPVSIARVAAVVLAIGTVALCLLISPWLAAVVGGYLVMNLAYSTALKHVAVVDVTIIATGFVLRVLAGQFATGVDVSNWLLGCTFLLALYLAMGKRAHEFHLHAKGEGSATRKVLDRYREEHLQFGTLFVAGLTIAVYTIWTLTAALPNLTESMTSQPLHARPTPFASPWLLGTILFAVVGIVRFYQLVTNDDPHSPTDQILGDKPFILNLVCWGVAMLAVAYA
jgi:4-hydroxybenzoate polyprenyltransferase